MSKTPLERAAEALDRIEMDGCGYCQGQCMDYDHMAAVALTAALDRDEIAGALIEAGIHFYEDYQCYCDEEPGEYKEKEETCLRGRLSSADAVIAHLLGGDGE